MRYSFLLVLIFPFLGKAQTMVESEDSVIRRDIVLHGTLSLPTKTTASIPLLILIAGSGPTDRNCNSGAGFKSEAFSKLAKAMAEKNIAVFRYDKRGVGQSIPSDSKEENVRFDDMVQDCKAIIQHYLQDKRFKRIVVAGHSEGSLVGMLSVPENCRYVSIAGIADDGGAVLKTQLKGQLGTEKEAICFAKLDSLRSGNSVSDDDPQLKMLFRASVQPYLISWFKHNPAKIIAELKNPILIINGSNDIQVAVEQAEKLHKANLNSKLVVIPNMNHVLIETTATSKMENMMTYNKAELPLSKAFIEELAQFVLKN